MSDRPRGSGWWLASNGKWYPPEDALDAAPPPPPPPSEPPGEGWWLASDANWYPPESRRPAAAAVPPADAGADWWLASDGNWYPPETRPGEAQRPQPGWWLASDGNWYPPESRPHQATVTAPPVAPEAAPARIGAGMSTALRYFLYAVALLSALSAVLTLNEVARFDRFVDGGRAAPLVDAENATESAVGWLALAFLATGMLFIAWLHQAYKAIVSLGAEGRRWSPGWAIGGWFIPFANLVIPKLVINEVDRVSAAGPPPVGTSWKGSPILTVGSFWWGAFIFGAVGVAIGSAISGAELEADVFDAGVYRAGLIIVAVGYGLYALAALLATRVVRVIGSRLDTRRPTSDVGTA